MKVDVDSLSVNSLAEARLALAYATTSGREVLLCDVPGALRWQGPGWLVTIVGLAARDYPLARWTTQVYGADEVGLAMAALTAGVNRVVMHPATPALERLQAWATAHGGTVEVADPANAGYEHPTPYPEDTVT